MRDHHGLAVDFVIEGDYPQYGNNDDRVDAIACDLVERFMRKIQALPTWRQAVPTQSILTITSNVVYGPENRQHPGRTSGGGRRSLRGPIRCMAATGKGRWRR
ncbi:putative formate acetyltransferase [Klebsiella pneumoniae subsp. pneumoniae]|uniref:Putative formate acetyltransferase n=1 Tax=Klebsiella pneumoniae subsp. pneumoniae TaxID=72407 RepID=A0A377ZF49_KLEPN|nr:putative formate acetyltransferase [Klebsiella pneumoniae subsp. pneumoniae]